jgi:hypothetical protein
VRQQRQAQHCGAEIERRDLVEPDPAEELVGLLSDELLVADARRDLGPVRLVVEAELRVESAAVFEQVLDHPDQAADRDRDGQLLPHLADQRLGRELAGFDGAARQGPEAIATEAVEQEPVRLPDDGAGTASGDQRLRHGFPVVGKVDLSQPGASVWPPAGVQPPPCPGLPGRPIVPAVFALQQMG